MRYCAAVRRTASLIVGETGTLSEVKYVITLDTDTQLPRDAAHQLVGTMAHPLKSALLRRKETSGRGYSFFNRGSD